MKDKEILIQEFLSQEFKDSDKKNIIIQEVHDSDENKVFVRYSYETIVNNDRTEIDSNYVNIKIIDLLGFVWMNS